MKQLSSVSWLLLIAKPLRCCTQAIHLSRPDPDVHDLIRTGQKILESFKRGERDAGFLNEKMTEIARAYFDYYRAQRIANFHGLRDFCKVQLFAGCTFIALHTYPGLHYAQTTL